MVKQADPATDRKAGHGSVKALGGTGQKKGGYGKGNWGKAGESAEDLPLGEQKDARCCPASCKTCPHCAPWPRPAPTSLGCPIFFGPIGGRHPGAQHPPLGRMGQNFLITSALHKLLINLLRKLLIKG